MMRKRNIPMIHKTLTAAVTGAVLLTAAIPAFADGVGRGPIFFVRIYTSEVPSSVVDEGQYVRIGVMVPPGSKVAKVEAFMDVTNYGRSIDKWHSCDFKTGDCELDDARVSGLARTRWPTEDIVTADFWNLHRDTARFAKLRVTFLPIGNMRETWSRRECWLRVVCGFAGWMDKAFEEEAPVKGIRPDL